MIFDSGKHWLIDKRNAEGEALGWLNFNKALAKSDNVYFYEMGNRVGIEELVKYAGYFGIGEKTGINLAGEAAGNMASPAYKRKVFDEDWYLGETFDAAIGQSFTLTTPLQMAVMLSEVANGGIKYRPYVVSRIDNKDDVSTNTSSMRWKSTLGVTTAFFTKPSVIIFNRLHIAYWQPLRIDAAVTRCNQFIPY